MRALGIEQFGGIEQIKALDIAEPTPGENDLLVEVYACAMNPVDTKMRQGMRGIERVFPAVLGYDVSGVVREVGSAVEGFSVGDEVIGSPSLGRNGSNAEQVLLDSRTAAAKPTTLDHVHGAAMSLVTLTAWEALFNHAHLHHGQTVLIHAGGGGVGHMAIQIAKDHNCRVLTTAGRDKTQQLAMRCGADLVINHRQEDVLERVKQETDGRGCDVVFETVGGENLHSSVNAVAVHGTVVSILPADPNVDLSPLFTKDAELAFEFMGAAGLHGVGLAKQGESLRTAVELVDAGKLHPHVSQTLALDQLQEAHKQLESGHTTGKVVLVVKDND